MSVAVVGRRVEDARRLAQRLAPLKGVVLVSERNVGMALRGCVIEAAYLDDGVEVSEALAEALYYSSLGAPRPVEVYRLQRVSLPPPF
ncbi:hypothetical protein PBI_KESHU_91 [Mycobacterium phage Keshu]|uniref:Uncharacterized protein n=1 Tax=Mycobacterium phage Keshu TaxID=1567471 RepID=A0A0B5A5G6_9CAUD|nr:hypothetical protein PBI_KESHU_91 [Mycobacterium phage Keshu]AJD82311.1 hypothetical protein PBI_KESHU_91 [Mycobacterium phage Keshu]